MPGVTEELTFKFYLILVDLRLNLKSPMWPMAAILDNAVLEHESMSAPSTKKAFRRALSRASSWVPHRATSCLGKRCLSPVCIKVGYRPTAAYPWEHSITGQWEGRRELLEASGKTFFLFWLRETAPHFFFPPLVVAIIYLKCLELQQPRCY